MSIWHLIENHPLLRENSDKDPSLLSKQKKESLENELVRSKLWRSKFFYLDQWESCLACQPFLSSNEAFEELVLRSLKASPLHDKVFTDTWRVAGGEVCILGSLCWIEVCAHVENGFLLKSFAVISACIIISVISAVISACIIRKVISISEISAVSVLVIWISYCWKNLSKMKFHDLKQIQFTNHANLRR